MAREGEAEDFALVHLPGAPPCDRPCSVSCSTVSPLRSAGVEAHCAGSRLAKNEGRPNRRDLRVHQEVSDFAQRLGILDDRWMPGVVDRYLGNLRVRPERLPIRLSVSITVAGASHGPTSGKRLSGSFTSMTLPAVSSQTSPSSPLACRNSTSHRTLRSALARSSGLLASIPVIRASGAPNASRAGGLDFRAEPSGRSRRMGTSRCRPCRASRGSAYP